MNSKVKKGLFWGGIISSMFIVLNIFYYLLGGMNAFAAGHHGQWHRNMGPHGGFEPQRMISPYHHGFSWIWFLVLLILGIVILFLVWKSLRRKSKASAIKQFIDTSLMNSHRPISNQSANLLDQWEKNLVKKKENV